MLLSEVYLHEVLGFSREEKLEKLKKQVTELLAKNNVKLAKELSVFDNKNSIKIYATAASYKDCDFGEYGAQAQALYLSDSKCVKPANPKAVDQAYQKLEIKNTVASAVATMLVRQFQIQKHKREEYQEDNEQRRNVERNEWEQRKRKIYDKVNNATEYTQRDYNPDGSPVSVSR